MVCGGFTCSKNALCALNVVYMLVGLLLIGVAAWGKGFGIVSSITVIGGVIAIGVFLLLIAIVGLIGAANHHQVMLFMEQLLNATWAKMSNNTKIQLENTLDCCGLVNDSSHMEQYNKDYASCPVPCKPNCITCGWKMLQHAGEALKILGGVGLFFSFTEILGVWLAIRYRNQKDPRANPSAFL